jgi:hypothetical protein
MANVDKPFGFRPVRYKNGAPWNGQATPYFVASGDGTALFLGDPVVSNGNSNTTLIGRGHEPGTLVSVIRATAGDANPILGVVVGVEPETRDSLVYRAASTARVVLVADDPNLIFHAQDDAAGTPGAGNAFTNANLKFTHSGSTVTGISGAEIDGAGFAADQSFQLLVLGLARLPNNEVASDNAVWEVMINTHQFKGGAVGTTLGIL